VKSLLGTFLALAHLELKVQLSVDRQLRLQHGLGTLYFVLQRLVGFVELFHLASQRTLLFEHG